MTLNPMLAKMGLTLTMGVTGFANQSIAASLAGKLQKYRNEMSEMTGAMNERAILLNEAATLDASRRLQFTIAMSAAKDQGAAEVSAAVAGTGGRNVSSTMRGLRRSEMVAQAARKTRVGAEMRQHQTERVNNRVATILNRDITVQQRPSLLLAGIGMMQALHADFDANQPEGDKLGDRLRRLGAQKQIDGQRKEWWE